jgi:hypothetical protein
MGKKATLLTEKAQRRDAWWGQNVDAPSGGVLSYLYMKASTLTQTTVPGEILQICLWRTRASWSLVELLPLLSPGRRCQVDTDGKAKSESNDKASRLY